MLQIYALCCGYLEMDHTLFLPDHDPGTYWTVPVPGYLITHPQGRLLFDTGVHCQAISDPVGRLGERRAQRMGVRSQAHEEVVSQLARMGLRPDDITYVVNSHFHFDHCGGNEFFPHSRFLVQQHEMEAARNPEVAAQNGLDRQNFDHPLDYQLVDGEHDVFGDGKVVLMPTPGHTPGHQSLSVHVSKGTHLVFAADACYLKENMDRDILPQVVWDAGEMSHSLAALRHLRDQQGVTLLYGHDPGQWQTIRHAPESLV